ncbi:flagellar basal-body rod protein FlgF [Methylobrevis albus]|uniref:Flagellar basal-body rod protein FlgF n=1 Tax=Methylobrevis albus TaxID=2793297 RepID=A0A931I028_9HYPH|nr:flagellar basal-body rod protein FlgF [Methylobrevis albus]MBH0236870.1 flagellar basal-body rod protein FlgF [Methylobrevis albus]
MENATLVALSRQIALRRNLDVIADNVANITTDGFKRQALNFEEFVMPKARASSFERADRINTFVADWTTTTDFGSGSIEQSGNPLDVAINGNGFFVVQTPDGERYTRAGNFRIDNGGRLVTADGQPVLGEGGEILFEQNEIGIEIGADGSIASSAGVKGRLRLVAFEDDRLLRKAGANLFETDAAPEPAVGVQVMQGAIERSNVSGVVEMTRMINATRSYEQITKVIKDQDELRSRAISRLGQLN